MTETPRAGTSTPVLVDPNGPTPDGPAFDGPTPEGPTLDGPTSDAPPPDAPRPDDPAGRLTELTLLDERRLRRRLRSARRISDTAKRGRALDDIDRQVTAAQARLARRQAAVPTLRYPPELPVSDRVDDIAAAIAGNQVVIVAGETGSGKSTQMPKICLQIGRGVRGSIGHTQPRRIAARALAERIAEETGTSVGGAIGYAIRFGDHTGPDTLVKLMTDGILLNEITRDRLLLAYDTIIIDEAHERSLNIDFLLGYLKELLPRRPDLKLIITSATIDPQRFSRHFGDAPVVEVSGRTYPVEIRYRPFGVDDQADVDPEDVPSDPEERPGAARRTGSGTRPSGASGAARAREEAVDQAQAICAAADELMAAGDGDILVFLSGEREITDTAEVLRGHLAGRRGVTEVLPLYGRLSSADQHKVFSQHAGRRIVLATNVAETSLTVPGIRYVIDPGTARISRYSPRSKVQRLPIEPISQASAGQRAGRCGRVANGICIRLYSAGRFPGAAGIHRPGDRPDFAGLGDPADGVTGSGRHLGLPLPRSARPAADHRRRNGSHRTRGVGAIRFRAGPAHHHRAVHGRVAAGSPAGPDPDRGQQSGLPARGADHRRGAGDRGRPGVPAGGAGQGSGGALPVRRPAVRFQRAARALGRTWRIRRRRCPATPSDGCAGGST